nr:sigma-70 family RNA polymerase sigma factor [Lysinibacter cavernae]
MSQPPSGGDQTRAATTTGAARDLRDAALIEAFRNGDDEAMETLFSLHQPYALQHAARYATAQLPADDIVSEAFFRVIQAIRNGNGPTVSLWWYLVTAMKSVAIKHAPSLQRTVNVEAETLELLADETVVERSDGVAETCVVEAFNRLPSRWQTVVWCRDVEGFSLAETAATLGITANAVGALHSRARTGFRLEYLSAIAADEMRESCLRFVRELARDESEAALPREVTEHLSGCTSCRSKQEDLRTIRGRFAGALTMVAPGLFFEHPWAVSPFGADAAASLIVESPLTAGAGALLTGKSLIGAATGLIGIAAVAGTLMLVSSMGQASTDPGQSTAQTSREALKPSSSEQPTAVDVGGGNRGIADEGPLTEATNAMAPGDGGAASRTPLIEVPAAGGVCQIFFEPSAGSRMAYFEQQSVGGGACLVDVLRPNGSRGVLDHNSSTRLAQAAQASTYTIVIETDVTDATAFSVPLRVEDVSREG